ncbi:MAG TPA: hypothetical protein VK850_04500, partial [Candidatus Binatia bacterium]|nr:hypothetical protein [Candidatus Binatia bacterium]
RNTTYYWRVDEVKSSGTVTGDVWSFTSTSPKVFEWNFANGDLAPALGNGVLSYADGASTSNSTSFGVSDGSTVPHIGGYPTRYMRVPGFASAASGYHVTLTDTGPNGGGVYINQFTVIFDMLVPAPLGRTALFNTNPQNANDADFYVETNGRVGTSGIGYSTPGVIASNAWHRIAFVADLAAGTVAYYVNGNSVFNGASALDGRYSLYSAVDGGPDVLLFNEGDTSGVYTHVVYLSSFAFTDRAITAAEIQSLGGVNDLGIFVHTLPALVITRDGNQVRLNWRGGPGIRLQRSAGLAPTNWADVNGTVGLSNFVESISGDTQFYRLTR